MIAMTTTRAPPTNTRTFATAFFALGLMISAFRLWWLERQERIAAQEKNSVMSEKVIVAMLEMRTTLQTFGVILSGGPRPQG